MSEEKKLILSSFLDVADHENRKLLVKATDSNSIEKRLDGIKYLIRATWRADDQVTHLKRTLKFLRQKIKNEQITVRARALGTLCSSTSWERNKTHGTPYFSWTYEIREPNITEMEHHCAISCYLQGQMMKFSNCTMIFCKLLWKFKIWINSQRKSRQSEVIGGLWRTLRQDPMSVSTPRKTYFRIRSWNILEVSGLSLGKATDVDFYWSFFSKAAIQAGAKNPENGLLNFGIELQWRIALFRHGPKQVANKFVIKFPIIKRKKYFP